MEKPIVSVIVPVYNVKDYCEKCLTSLASQTYPHIEVVVIDDGSTDGSGAICDTYGKRDSRFRVFHTKNGGLSAARNYGIKKSTGKYLTFVDGDDFVVSDYIEALIREQSANHSDVVICRQKQVRPGENIQKTTSMTTVSHLSPEDCLSQMLLEDEINLSACAMLISRHLMSDISFPVGKYHEDVGTTYRIIMAASQISLIHTEKYYYVQRGSSIIHSFSDGKLDLVTLTDEMCDAIDAAYPALLDATRIRRMHARFSILRQIPLDHQEARNISSYLRQHRDYILANKKAAKRDVAAMICVLIGDGFYQRVWKIYEHFFR